MLRVIGIALIAFAVVRPSHAAGMEDCSKVKKSEINNCLSRNMNELGNGLFQTKIPVPDMANAEFDNACANAEASIQSGLTDPLFDDWITKCSRHPDKTRCDDSVSFIRGIGKPIPPKLVCKGNN